MWWRARRCHCSAAVGPKVEGQAQGDYINTVWQRSVLPALGLLRRLHALEASGASAASNGGRARWILIF